MKIDIDKLAELATQAASHPELIYTLPEKDRARVNTMLALWRSVDRFDDFVRVFWEVIEPARPLVWNWHLDIVCDAVQRQVDGDPAFRRLLIMVSPGDLKSVIVSVMRPAWVWLRQPTRRSLYFSHGDTLAVRDSRRTRDIVTHDVYARMGQTFAVAQKKYARMWTMVADQNEKVNFENDFRGSRQCSGLYSDFTGIRGDDVVIDDPLDAGEVLLGSPDQVKRRVDECNAIIAGKVQSRVNDARTATWTLMMQRLCEGDPAQVAIEDGDWHVVCLPKEYVPDHPYRHPKDPRTEPGELLNKNRDDAAEMARLRRKMGVHFDIQYNQIVRQGVGGLFPKSLFDEAPRYQEHATDWTEIVLSVDCTFKKSADSDRVAMHVWGRRGWGRRTLLDRTCRQMTFTETMAEALRLQRAWGATTTLVEDKANGPAVIDALTDAIPGLVAFNPGTASKYERAQVNTAPKYIGRQVELPDRARFPWVVDFELAHTMFRAGGDNDDDIDAESQYHAWCDARMKQAPWLDAALVVPPEPAVEPSWSTPGGHGRLWVHDWHALIAPVGRLVVGIAATAAVVGTDQGDILGSMWTDAGADNLAQNIAGLMRESARRCGMSDTQAAAARAVVRLAQTERDTARADALRDALRRRGVYVHMEDEVRGVGYWRPSPGALAVAATHGQELASVYRLRVHDPKVRGVVEAATLHPETGVPDLPVTRDVAARMLPRPVAMDALLVAALACVETISDLRQTVVDASVRDMQAQARASSQPGGAYAEMARRWFGPQDDGMGRRGGLWQTLEN